MQKFTTVPRNRRPGVGLAHQIDPFGQQGDMPGSNEPTGRGPSHSAGLVSPHPSRLLALRKESGVSPVGEGLELLLRQGYEAVIAGLARQVTCRREILPRCLSLIQFGPRQAPAEVGSSIVRLQADRFVVIGPGRLGVAELLLRQATINVGSTKSVLLIGCGSVGSEIAHQLASAGVGNLTIADPEYFHEHNLYRHTLAIGDIDSLKSWSVAKDLRLKHPWIVVTPSKESLADWTRQQALERFDLVVIAIGSPTEERVFHDCIQRTGVRTPVMNTWVEAYGVGGHATLDLPLSKGCFRCAYVDPDTLTRGLASNLNFLEPNQDVTVTHAGCGNQFLPYSGISASYTATMAADLATQCLQGQVNRSSKISWKGSAAEAEEHGFKMSHRYRHFTKTLEILPLLNSECDVCSS